MSIRKLRAGRVSTVTASQYVGENGSIFWDEATGILRLSDGNTTGGSIINNPAFVASSVTAPSNPFEGQLWYNPTSKELWAYYNNEFRGTINPATPTILGGIKVGPGMTVSNDGLLTIDAAGLPISFGDFYASVPPNGAATLSSVNLGQNIDIVSNDGGVINAVGSFHVHTTATYDPNDPDANGSIFSVDQAGAVRILVPVANSTSGAIEIIGSLTGEYQNPLQTGVMMHVTGQNSDANRVYFDGNNGYAVVAGRRYNGNAVTPTAVKNNDILVRFGASAYNGVSWLPGGVARMEMNATEDHDASGQGTNIKFYTTTKRAVSPVARLTLDEAGATIQSGGKFIGALTGKADTAGNADTVTNGVYTNGSYTNPSWITSLAASKVGLGSVENTALSTWVGTSNITTVGTLTSGTIGAGFTAIANARLANSTVTVNGTSIALGASATVTAAADTLTGTTLNSTVVTSSLTSVGTLASLNVTGAIVAGSFSGKLYRGVRDAGTIADGGTLTIDFSTDAIVHCVWGNGMTLAYQNYTAGAVVRVMAVKSTGTGTDSISLDGITASHVNTGNLTVSATADTTVFMEFTCTGTTLASLFLKV